MSAAPAENLRGSLIRLAIGATSLGVVLVVLFFRAMERGLNHDEHQFLAPAVLLAREGLLPYRDFPLFHLPNLTFIYAGLAKLTPNIILAARLFSFGCVALLFLVLFVVAWRSQGREHSWLGLAAGMATVGLFACDPLFLRTAGKTWNHDLPSLLFVAAMLVVAYSARRPSQIPFAVGGLLAGLAIGARLTFAPLTGGLFVAVFLLRERPEEKIKSAIVFALGVMAALLPSAIMYLQSPDGFIFGNFQYPRVALSDPGNERIHKTITFWRKVRYLLKEIILPDSDDGKPTGSWALVLLWLLVALVPGFRFWKRREGSVICGLSVLLLPFALAGAFAPSRYQNQHFYFLVVLFALGAAAGLGTVEGKRRLPALGLAMVLALVSAGLSYKEFPPAHPLPPVAKWHPIFAQKKARSVRELVGSGRVLTLAPTTALQAGLQIYPELAAAPFSWRSARLVPAARRASLHMLAPDDLADRLSSDPPAAIWTGVDDAWLERPFLEYAKKNGFRPVQLNRDETLWLPGKG